MLALIALQTTDVAPPSNLGLVVLTGGLIGIYAARRRYRKESFRELTATPIMIGAGLGALLLTSFLLVAALRTQPEDTAYLIGKWFGWGLGGALLIGGPAALLARFGGSSTKGGPTSTPQVGNAATALSEEPPVRFTVNDAVWRVTRQAGVNAGARAPSGDYDLPSQGAGLWFHQDEGKSLFLSMDIAALPSEADLRRMTVAQVANMLQRATPL